MTIIISDQSTAMDSKIKWTLFSLISIVFVLYIYRNVVVLNAEIVLIIIFTLTVWIIWRRNEPITKAIWVWCCLLLLYWFVTLIATYAHYPPGKRALTILGVASLVWVFAALTIALYRLRPNIDFFWGLTLVGGVVALSLGVFDAYELGWFSSGFFSDRLGSIHSHAVKYAVIVNSMFIILLGSFSWAYRKHWLFLFFVFCIVVGLFMISVLSQSRTAWIGWPEALIGWGLYYSYLLKNKFSSASYLNIASVAGVITLLVVITLSLDFLRTPLVERSMKAVSELQAYTSGENMKGSIGYRLAGYEVAIEQIPKTFWFGIGEDAFPEFIKSKSSEFALKEFNQKISGFEFSQLHNQYLMSFLTKGVFSFISIVLFFVFLVVFFIRHIRRSDGEKKAIAVAGLVFSISSFLAFMPETPLQNADTAIHFFLLCSLLIVFTAIEESTGQTEIDIND